METLLAALVLLLTVTVALLAFRTTRASSASPPPTSSELYATELQRLLTAQSSEMFRVTISALDSKERESKRDETLMQVAQHLLRLDTTVSNLFLQMNNRTVLRPAKQYGEESQESSRSFPLSPTVMDWTPPSPGTMPDGLEDPISPEKVVAPAFAEAT